MSWQVWVRLWRRAFYQRATDLYADKYTNTTLVSLLLEIGIVVGRRLNDSRMFPVASRLFAFGSLVGLPATMSSIVSWLHIMSY
jgi:hypothetical protein